MAVLGGLLALLATCVVAAQLRGSRSGTSTGAGPTAPSRASLGSSESATPEDSGPPATPWRKTSWRKATKRNQIIGLTLPPKPPASTARKDPQRVSVALLAGMDSTNPSEWEPGVNPLRSYMSTSLAKIYTPEDGGEEGEDSSGGAVEKLPENAEARYEFYCYVAEHTKKTVVSHCGYHVKVSSAGKALREETGVEQRVTAKRTEDGWRVAKLAPASGRGGD